jgi:phosphate transport system protein
MTLHSVSPVDLAELDSLVVNAFTLVRQSLAGATEAFLTGNREAARRVAAEDEAMDELHIRIEDLALRGLTQPGGPGEAEARNLLMVVRIAPELERSGDLATHIAALAAQNLAAWLTPRGRDLVAQMGAVGVEMWGMAADAYVARDTKAGARLRAIDDEIDDLHVSLTAEVASARVSVPVAIQMGLAARFFERLGDHAVNVTQRLRLA